MKKPENAGELIVKMQFGSHVYGTNVPTSDFDYKSLVLPRPRDILLQKAFKNHKNQTKEGNGKNKPGDIDDSYFGLHYWFKLLSEGQTMCYDMLFTPEKFLVNPFNRTGMDIWETIQSNSDKLVNSRISAFAGYCQAQAAKYSLKGSNLAGFRAAMTLFAALNPHVKLRDIRQVIKETLVDVSATEATYNGKQEPVTKFVIIPHKQTGAQEEYLQIGGKTKVPMHASVKVALDCFTMQFKKYGERAKQAETNNGVDWKALMHAVRICKEAEELLLTGHIDFPRPEAPLLLRIRKGEMTYKAVEHLIVEGLDNIKRAQEVTTLPDAPDQEWIDDFIANEYYNVLRREF